MKGFLINADTRRIEPLEYEYTTMRQWLPSGICIGQVFANGDVLYVDDECLLRPAERAFRIKVRPDGQPMMSHAILTGRDSDDPHSNDTLPPSFTAEELAAEIEWLTVDQALDWFRRKAAEPAVTMSGSETGTTVLAVWGDLLANLEGREGYRP